LNEASRSLRGDRRGSKQDRLDVVQIHLPLLLSEPVAEVYIRDDWRACAERSRRFERENRERSDRVHVVQIHLPLLLTNSLLSAEFHLGALRE